MDGREFGKFIKKYRKQLNIKSKSLSLSVGKAQTYVSQLERGLIKNPAYDTSYKLLEELSFEKENINKILRQFNIFTDTDREKQLYELLKKQAEDIEYLHNNPDKVNLLNADEINMYYKNLEGELKLINNDLHTVFMKFIEKDISKAENVFRTLQGLISNQESFNFLIQLLSKDYGKLDNNKRIELLSCVDKFIDMERNE